MVKINPLTGNAVITGAILIAVFQALLALLRAYGYQVTSEQEAALVGLLNSPLGDVLAIIVTLVVAWVVQRANVYSLLSVENLTGMAAPKVPKTTAALEAQRDT